MRRLFSEPSGGSVRAAKGWIVPVICAVLLVGWPMPSQAWTVAPSSSSTVLARDLPRREMNDTMVINRKGWLILKGNVDPGWNHKRVQIYKRLCKGCAWKLVKKVETDGIGRWKARVFAPRTGYWYWKGIVPKANGYGKSVTRIYRTYVV